MKKVNYLNAYRPLITPIPLCNFSAKEGLIKAQHSTPFPFFKGRGQGVY
jgi:hypothetical protein